MQPSPVGIRQARAADLVAVCRIVNHYIASSTVNFRTEPQTPAEWEARWRELRERYPWYVAEQCGTVTGVAYATPWSPRGAYAWTAESVVYVAPDRHGQGGGSALYRRLLGTRRGQGYRSVLACVAGGNPGGTALHRDLGFAEAGTFRAVGHKFGAWHDVSYWQLSFPGTDVPGPPGEIRAVPPG